MLFIVSFLFSFAALAAAIPAFVQPNNLTTALAYLALTDFQNNVTADQAISRQYEALANVTIFASNNGAYAKLNLVERALLSNETIVRGGLEYVVVNGVHKTSSFPQNTTILPTYLESNLTKHQGPADIKIVKQGDNVTVVSAAELSSNIVLGVSKISLSRPLLTRYTGL